MPHRARTLDQQTSGTSATHTFEPRLGQDGASPEQAALFASAKVPKRLMLACYPGSGGRYVAHLDNDPSDPAYEVGPVGLRACDRVFTCILYLNDAWEAPHEGCLRMFTRSRVSLSSIPERPSRAGTARRSRTAAPLMWSPSAAAW